jgi:hypothetical protein
MMGILYVGSLGEVVIVANWNQTNRNKIRSINFSWAQTGEYQISARSVNYLRT